MTSIEAHSRRRSLVREWIASVGRVWGRFVGVFGRRLLCRVIECDEAYEEFIAKFPYAVMVHQTNTCNARCLFCAYTRHTDPKQIMSQEVFEKVVDGMVEGGAPSIDLTPVVGEALIDPEFIRKVEYARKAGITYIVTHTNGILLTRGDLVRKMVELMDEIHVSLPGLDDESYRRLFGVDKAEEVTEGLVKLAEEKKRTDSDITIGLQFRLDRPFEEVLDSEGMRRSKPYVDDGTIEYEHFYYEMDNWSGQVRADDLPGDMRVKKAHPHGRRMPCHMLFIRPGILPDGKVRLCGWRCLDTSYDALVVGDVNDNGLLEILFSDAHKRILTDFANGDEPLVCRDCTFYGAMSFTFGQYWQMGYLLACNRLARFLS